MSSLSRVLGGARRGNGQNVCTAPLLPAQQLLGSNSSFSPNHRGTPGNAGEVRIKEWRIQDRSRHPGIQRWGMELGMGREDWEEEGVTTYNVLPTYTIPQAPFLHTNSYHKCLGPQPLKMAWFLLTSPFIPCELHKKQ